MNSRLKLAALGLSTVMLFATAASAQVGFDGNILYRNNGGSTVPEDQYGTDPVVHNCPELPSPTDAAGIAGYYFYNQVIDPDLNANYADPETDNWRPNSTSPALVINGQHTTVQVSAYDPFFTDEPFAGALSDDAAEDWTQCPGGDSWVYTDLDGGLARGDVFDGLNIVVVPSGDVAAAGTVNWTFGNVYVIQGRVSVPAGVTLDIEPGVVVAGETGTDAYLVVERDGFLDAQGTCDEPIIFTSDQFPGDQTPGDWGGVVLHGKAQANCGSGGAVEGCGLTSTGLDCISEGAAGNFGGSDDADGSATIRYAGVEYAGREISLDNELNAWTMNAQGTGTSIEYIYANQGTDDSFEWFGGTPHTKYFVAVAGADDGLDFQMGYRGFHQYAIIQSISLARGGQDGDSGVEGDNNEFDPDCPLRSNPCFANLTLIGSPDIGGRGARIRVGADAGIFNSVIVDWDDQGFRYGETPGDDGLNLPNCLRPRQKSVATGIESVYGFRVTLAPNPVVGQSTFAFNLPQQTNVQVKIFNAAGRLIDTVYDGSLASGDQLVHWAPGQKSAGVYYYSVVAGNQKAKGKLLVAN